MLRPLIAVGLCLGVALFACGGQVVPGETASSSSSSGGSTSSGGGTSSGGVTTGTSGGVSSSGSVGACSVETYAGDRVCVPGVALAGLPVTVAIDSQSACLGCYSTPTTCEVTVNGNDITLDMTGQSCPPATNPLGCDPECGTIKETCTIPPLAAGTYNVAIAGSQGTGFYGQTLVVGENGTGAACTLPPIGTEPPPLDASKYSTACKVDTDCTSVITGNVCGLCTSACGGTTPIAVADKALYDADYRAAVSQCEPSYPAPCPFCPAFVSKCLLPADSDVGTCVSGAP